MLKVLNLYAGIGGNRKLWEDVEVTAVELDPKISQIYHDFFPNDKIVIGNAHDFLLDYYKDYDFIWTSPPCPTHSRLNDVFGEVNGIKYPDMNLYQEIILLREHFSGKFCVENVISYYKPLYPPQEVCGHYFWSNFHIGSFPMTSREHYGGKKKLEELKGFSIDKYTGINKTQVLRNCVNPYLGLHILNESKKNVYQELFNPHV